MILQFFLRYSTQYGQQIFLISKNLPGTTNGRFLMQFFDHDYWMLQIPVPDDFTENIRYYYAVRNADGLEITDGEKGRSIELPQGSDKKRFVIHDIWNDAGDYKNAYFTKAFKHTLLSPVSNKKYSRPQIYTHEFRVKAPLLKKHETVCLCGSTKSLRNWDKENPILMTVNKDWFYTRMNFAENEWPASYKYGIYNLKEKKLVAFEEGKNRLLKDGEFTSEITILHDGFVNIHEDPWRCTGVNIPVFSLRSQKSFGTGEFTDLKLLVDWAVSTGLELIQLLPINDTSAQNTWEDSYPYAAISSYALHPLYINLSEVAGDKGVAVIKALKRKQTQLNALSKMDYEQVMKFKLSALYELYDLLKVDLRKDKKYQKFFQENKHWLVPYAAFCYLKEKYNTADFNLWKKYAVYDEDSIKKLVSSKNKAYDKIAFYYFVQYHLHSQLLSVADYAHSHKVILKGDIPIGIYRYSCDAWLTPGYFIMSEQAGAPPDAFATTGQNWEFPIYNWEVMKKDNFKWWKSRFEHLSKYFDVFRIDHILGFFRIWSIPLEQIEGIMGRFRPMLPVHKEEFDQRQISFNKDRFCKPYITKEIVNAVFENNSGEAIDKFLIHDNENTYSLKEEVNSQRKALAYLEENNLLHYREGLFLLIGNVILFEEDPESNLFHFRIDMADTLSFKSLDENIKPPLKQLYIDYFFNRQNYFWKKEAMQKLPSLKRSTDMLICGEDLGMVPENVPEVMLMLGILGLDVERMPKSQGSRFFNPSRAKYMSVVTPSTHDMSTLREWWEEDAEITQIFYNQVLGHTGYAPARCEPEIVREIIAQHLNSPAMCSIFLLQDLLALDKELTTENPSEERINIPSEPHHYWRYRMFITLEKLLKNSTFNKALKGLIEEGGRLHKK